MTVTEDRLVVYTFLATPFGQRVRALMEEGNIKYELEEINPAQKPDWYCDVNPIGKFPALRVGDKTMGESWVIMEFLNDQYLESRLMPKDPLQRAKARYAVTYITEKIVTTSMACLFNFRDETTHDTYRKQMTEIYSKLNELMLENSPSGPYFFGEEFSLVDLALAPLLLRTEAFITICLGGFTADVIKQHPRLDQFLEAVFSRPSIESTYVGHRAFLEVQNNFIKFLDKIPE